MGRRQQHVYHSGPSPFPPDFPERLDRLRGEAGLSWRGLARALRVEARTMRRWKGGTRPDQGHLYALFAFALERGLLHCLLPGAAGLRAPAHLLREGDAPAGSLPGEQSRSAGSGLAE